MDVARAIPGIVAVYLFGSVAEGREHTESDVDLGVLLDWSLYPPIATVSTAASSSAPASPMPHVATPTSSFSMTRHRNSHARS